MNRPKKPTETDEWLSLIHDRLEGIERALTSAPAAGQDAEAETVDKTKEKEMNARFKCDECGKEFASERALKSHKTKMHG